RVGLGIQLSGEHRRWHNGQTMGFRSYMEVDSAERRGVIMLLSTATYLGDGYGQALMNWQPGEVMNPPELPVALPEPPAPAAEYVGEYSLEGSVMLITARGRDVYAKLGPQATYPLFPSAMDEFFYRVAPPQLSFERDEHDHISALVLHQTGHDTRAVRRR